MPGITVTTQSRPGPSQINLVPGGRFFLPGITERGPLTPTILRSMGEYQDLFGSWVSYGLAYDQLNTYFAEGGGEACFVRVVGAAPTSGTVTLADSATPTTLGSSLIVTAANPGQWSANCNVEVDAGGQTNTFRVVVYYQGGQVEVFNNLQSPADAVTKINGVSNFITVAVGNTTAVAPQNNPAPTAAGGVALSAGNDQRASITSSTMVSALANFTADYGPGVVAIPDFSADVAGSGIMAHCAAFNRIAVTHPAVGLSVSGAKSAVGTLLGTTGAEGVGCFWPWVKIPNGSGGLRTIAPDGYVAAMRFRALSTAGPYENPAGEPAVARFVVDVEAPDSGQYINIADIASLDLSRISAIRRFSTVAGGVGGVRLYGWRSLSGDEVNYYDLTGRDTLNIASWLILQRLESFLFQPVDARGHMLASMANAIIAILNPWAKAGGLYAQYANNDPTQQQIDPGYSVDTGPDVNTAASLAANQVKANVGLRLSPAADFIYVTVTKVAVGNSLG